MKKHLVAIASAILVSFAPPAAFAAPAAAPALDPAVVAATREMLAAMKMRKVMAASLRQAEQQMPFQMQASLLGAIDGDTRMSAEEKAEARARVKESLPRLVEEMRTLFSDPTLADDMMAEMVPLYAGTYTLGEVRQLSTFYASPLGQKMLANMPKLMQQTMEISNRVMMPRIQKIMADAQGVAGQP
ncbi:DUF2059 domain-containing protein [uncultured Massilia sp.]|uniref:DUF2059 domain-containing protein n=1 Tax=uncultured Massilia sp. TaxID=169973 RepID=UPI0025FD3673|nr:DUF2059 domain-containing protein [uncultured Massilia sp.]